MVFSSRIGLRLRKRAANNTSNAGQRPSCTAFSYPMSCAGWLPLDLNGESPVQRTAIPQSSLKASRSTRRAVRFRRGPLLLLDPLQPDQLVTVENATQSASVRHASWAGGAAEWSVVMRGDAHSIGGDVRRGSEFRGRPKPPSLRQTPVQSGARADHESLLVCMLAIPSGCGIC